MDTNVMPEKQGNKYPDVKPPVDGDYLCFYEGFWNVFEYFQEKWFNETGERIFYVEEDGLYWYDLPPIPKECQNEA